MALNLSSSKGSYNMDPTKSLLNFLPRNLNKRVDRIEYRHRKLIVYDIFIIAKVNTALPSQYSSFVYQITQICRGNSAPSLRESQPYNIQYKIKKVKLDQRTSF